MIARGMGVELHVDFNYVVIDGQNFPACAVVCPPYPGDTDPSDSRVLFATGMRRVELPGVSDIFDVCVPMENGALVNLTVQTGDSPGIWLALYSRHCYPSRQPGEDPLWLPISLHPVDGRRGPGILCGCTRPSHYRSYDHCDADWVAESIKRWARFELVDCYGIDQATVTVIGVREGVEMIRTERAARQR